MMKTTEENFELREMVGDALITVLKLLDERQPGVSFGVGMIVYGEEGSIAITNTINAETARVLFEQAVLFMDSEPTLWTASSSGFVQ